MEKETKDWKTVAEAFKTWQKETTEDSAGILLFGNKEGEYSVGLHGKPVNIGLLLVKCAKLDDDFRTFMEAAVE